MNNRLWPYIFPAAINAVNDLCASYRNDLRESVNTRVTKERKKGKSPNEDRKRTNGSNVPRERKREGQRDREKEREREGISGPMRSQGSLSRVRSRVHETFPWALI